MKDFFEAIEQHENVAFFVALVLVLCCYALGSKK